MNHDSAIVNTNSIAFIGLCSEYCQALEGAREADRDEFTEHMLHLLPRLYVAATDLSINMIEEEEPYIDSALDEDYYESIRRNLETLFGPDDVYLEVFEENMKYSDTPVSASISEGLTDIFQSTYNFLSMVRNAPDEIVGLGLIAMRDEFRSYWSMTLCNVMRALNNLAYNNI
ncbi:MAG: DUF5063 domain-containing protein [Muribaculaceae bacterium]|nr:DUF5063 domain-containing protein [Muribaculaceae bacterium]